VYIYIFQNGIYGSCRLIFTRNLCKNYSICILKCLVIFTANSVLKICTKIQVTVPLSFYLVIFNKNVKEIVLRPVCAIFIATLDAIVF
jgi:hypothetical protein